MAKRYQVTEEAIREIENARKSNKNKNVEKRLTAILMHAQGKKRAEIAEKAGFAKSYISELISKYCNKGLAEIVENKYPGNRRNMSLSEEEVFLAKYKKQAEQGEIIEVSELKRAYEEIVGHSIGGSQIYCVLKRHAWRKVMPRSKHPNKASEEEIESSKKLTQR